MRPGDPELYEQAARELRALGFPVAKLLHRWLRDLTAGFVPVASVRVLLGAPRDPPWQRIDYADGIVVIFRLLSEGELKAAGCEGPQLLIARIVRESEVRCATEELFRDAP